jgi:hypothetical protein
VKSRKDCMKESTSCVKLLFGTCVDNETRT